MARNQVKSDMCKHTLTQGANDRIGDAVSLPATTEEIMYRVISFMVPACTKGSPDGVIIMMCVGSRYGNSYNGRSGKKQ